MPCRTRQNHRVSRQRRIGRHTLRLSPPALSGAPPPGQEPGRPGLDRRPGGPRHRRGRPKAPEGCASAGGPGRTTGAAGAASPDIWSTQAAPPAAAAGPDEFATHAAPPPADASGLNAKAAPHNPALAATVMPNKSIIFNANSPVFGLEGVFPQPKGAAELYRCPGSFPRRATELVANRDTTRVAP